MTTANGNLLIGSCGDFGYFTANLQPLRSTTSDEWDWAFETWGVIPDTMEIPENLFDGFEDDNYDYEEEVEEESYTDGEIVMEESETHKFVGNYEIYNGIVYAKFYGEIWHGYPGCVGYQSLSTEFTERWAETELPETVTLIPFENTTENPIRVFEVDNVKYFFFRNLANTLCCVAMLENDTLHIKDWIKYMTGATEIINLNPTSKVEWVKSIEEPEMTDTYFEFYYGMKR